MMNNVTHNIFNPNDKYVSKQKRMLKPINESKFAKSTISNALNRASGHRYNSGSKDSKGSYQSPGEGKLKPLNLTKDGNGLSEHIL